LTLERQPEKTKQNFIQNAKKWFLIDAHRGGLLLFFFLKLKMK
jgi:hypothetical protein